MVLNPFRNSGLFSGRIRRTLVMLVLTALVPVLIVQAWVYFSWFETRQANERTNNLEYARAVGNAFREFVRDITRQESAMGDALIALLPYEPDQANDFLVRNVSEYHAVRSFHWTDPGGKVIASSDPRAIGLDLSDREYFKRIAGGAEWAMSDLIVGRASGQPAIIVARGMRDASGALVGVAMASIDPSMLGEHVMPVDRPERGVILIYDRAGRLVYRRPEAVTPPSVGETDPLLASAFMGHEATGESVVPGANERYISARVPISDTGWVAGAGTPYSLVIAPLMRSLALDFALLALLAAASLLVASVLSGVVVAAVQRLKAHAQAVGAGDLRHRAEVSGIEELSELAAEFNTMAALLAERGRAEQAASDALKRANEELEREIAERKEAQARLHTALQKLSFHVENSPLGVIEWDTDYRITRWAGEAEKIFGWTASEVLGKRIDEFKWIYEEDLGKVADVMRGMDTGERPSNISANRNYRKDGAVIYCEWYNSALLDASGKMVSVMSLVLDVTAQTRAQDDLRARSAELEASNKELEAFAYSVSHDLRAPLRAIDGFSLALLEDYARILDDRGRDYLARVRAASQRMGALIDDLLKLSRVTRAPMNRQMVDLSRMVEDIADELSREEPNRKVEFVIEKGLTADGDPQLLRSALENLVNNAWKFTGRRADARIEFGARQQDTGTAYFIRDNGAGFDMAYADKLFAPFQRLHSSNEFPGTGVGLAAVQRVIHRHGGTVWAEGALGAGASFFFTLADGGGA